MTARIADRIDLDQVEETPWACGPYTRRALVAATRALLAVVEAERLDRSDGAAQAVCRAIADHQAHGGSIPWPSIRGPFEEWQRVKEADQ